MGTPNDLSVSLATNNVTIATDEPDLATHVNVTIPYWSTPLRATLAAILVAIGLLSFFGNALVLAVIIRYKGMRTRTNLFIANLALVDFLTAILCMPFSLTTVIRGEWIFGEIICQINGFLLPLVFITSIYTLTFISLHKYYTITNPLKTVLSRRIVVIMMICSWLVALLLAIIDIYGLNSVEFKHYTTQCGPKYPVGINGYLHNAVMTVTTYLIPVGIMMFSYIRMFKEIMAYSKRLEQRSSMERSSILNTQKKASLTLVIVVICFFVCWTPYLIYATYGSILKDKTKIPHWINPVCYWFGYLNSALNPIIYGLRNKSFSSGYRSIACSCFGKASSPRPDDDSKIFWGRKRSSIWQPDLSKVVQSDSSGKTSAHKKISSKMSDPSLPVVIRKNGKIIRIDEPPNYRRKRSSTVDLIRDNAQLNDVKNDKNVTVDKNRNSNNGQNNLNGDVDKTKGRDSALPKPGMLDVPKLIGVSDAAAIDSGNDSEMSDSPRNSANKILLRRSLSERATKKSDKNDRHSGIFRSFNRRKDDSPDMERKLDFWSMSKYLSKSTEIPQQTGDVEIPSAPSLDDLDDDVIMTSPKEKCYLHIRHSTPKHKSGGMRAFIDAQPSEIDV